MEKRKLGFAGPEVPVVCLGGNVYGWTLPEAEAFRQLDAALDAGLNFVDTADVYSRWVPGHNGGESETIIGKWFAKTGKREDVILATKVGMEMGEGNKGLKPAYIRRAVEHSLERLQTDYIDVYQAHKDDPETPLEETLGAFDELVKQGKVRYIGASNYSGARLAEALETSRKLGFASCISSAAALRPGGAPGFRIGSSTGGGEVPVGCDSVLFAGCRFFDRQVSQQEGHGEGHSGGDGSEVPERLGIRGGCGAG